MKIVHFADLHLDAQFAWTGASGDAARRRRQGLRDALGRIAKLVRETRADALFCGGDLYENDRTAPDTAEFLRTTFAELDPARVFLAPGNHDWYGPQSLYALVEWSPNVHVFTEPTLQPVELGSLTLWGGAHDRPAGTPNFLHGFRVAGPGAHIALFHGSERSWLAEQGEDKQPHAPFDVSEIETAGLHHAFLGHYHKPRDASRHTYPGNPEPLAFGEDGERGAVIATIDANGAVHRQRRRVAEGQAHDVDIDITGCVMREQVRERLDKATDGLSGVVRLTVSGEIDPGVELHEDELRDFLNTRFEAVQIRRGHLHAGYDLDAIRQEHTVRGQFVNDVLESDLPEDEQRRVLITGLRALDGHGDLEVL